MLRFTENLRGAEVAKTEEGAKLFAQDKPFSAMIFNGKGELFFKKIDGRWHQQIWSVDRCFGVMKSKWQPLNI